MAKSKLPEMLLRWNVFEDLFNEIMRPVKSCIEKGMCVPPELWEQACRETDQAVAAATRRGECLHDSSDVIVNYVWDRHDAIAKRKYPTDTRPRNT